MSRPTDDLRRHPHRARVVGSASIWVLGQVAGPRRTATVVHPGPDAVYLDLHGTCLAVLAARAVQVPCGVRTMLPRLPHVEAGTEATVQDGSIELPGCEVLVTSIVDTTVPVLERTDSHRQRLVDLLGDRLDAVRSLLPADVLDALAGGDPASIASLLGLGPGLTPLGDDVIAGWLATAVACRHPALTGVRSAVALSAHDRTTVLSATLLACAARGEGVPEFRSLLTGVATGDDGLVRKSLELLLRVGDTSGAGLVLGCVLALSSATERES